jgi:RNA polymerase sigma factor for flagellar operon FliA
MATAIENLPEREKLALSLYYYEDLNLKEIGQVLKISEGRVSQLQTQAMARLKIRLKGILKSTGEFETI